MKLRSVHVKGHPMLGDITVDVRGEDGVVPRVFGIWGATGTGKTLISKMIRSAWMSSVSDRIDYELYSGLSGYVTFEAGEEVMVVRVEGGVVQGNEGLRGYTKLEKREHCVVHYGKDRVWSSGKRTLGEAGLYWIFRDALWSGAVRDSVVLIDDFDLGLDSISREKAYEAVFQLHAPLGNQLILLSREPVAAVGRSMKLGDRRDDWMLGVREGAKRQV